MTQYLIRQFTDSTGRIHTDIEKARENETLSIVEAESKEEAKKKNKGLLNCIKPPKTNWRWLEDEYKKLGIFDKE
ncbi:DUF1381 domain-containing protein [Staphylococcus haemolyticus]|uniref:DUF1381 domain-containing protein n=1 Tax=Staphylococcus haemolyticus TaxID=1283 RepID=UPI000D1F94F2|nr:DUF1381 domain-containing protein [Staphylococcus haemolyticus]PTK82802.1 DUF1381 domain-containing protein [Staphylococcus haemolyticus]PTL05551.1 DUF1381 domain-containing protein [Staphylococcus haemolyticus]PTL15135.1 DUF1381 domain-containing protein [Staphylococcus haemolyticus]